MSPRLAEVRAALDRVLLSVAFQSSKRAQEFLSYILERALAGELDHLKERSIGTAVFGREPDYDTGSDSVVRVTANDVRKRLMRYYQEQGANEPLVFELPSGSYIPEIRSVAVKPEAPWPITEPNIPPKPHDRRLSWGVMGWATAATIACLWGWTTMSRNWTTSNKALHSLPWMVLFDKGHAPQLVMADSSMGILRDFKMFPVSVEDYSYRRFLDPLPGVAADATPTWRLIAQKRLTSIADARLASDFTRLAASFGRPGQVRSARDLQLNDFRKGENMILLGSAASNPWVELFQDQLDFQIQMDPLRPHQAVRIRNPRPQDPSGPLNSVSTGNTGESYASLALVRGLGGKGHVLIAQGTSMEGTDVAGDLAFNREGLDPILTNCGVSAKNANTRFEILLKVSTTAGSVRAYKVLATRCSVN